MATNWQIDRSISITHLLTVIAVLSSMFLWAFKLDARISVTEADVIHTQGDLIEMRAEGNRANAEMIRRLERIEDMARALHDDKQ